VAEELLGAILVHDAPDGVVAARLVEVEAYDGPEDRASHARFGRTSRTAPMFGPPGHAYVFLVYGLHHCLNVVTGVDGRPEAILLRAAAPLAGIDLMRRRRGRPHEPDARLAAGPGRLGVAFAIDRGLNGADLTIGRLRLVAADPALGGADAALGGTAIRVARGPRIGIAYAGEPWASVPWRFHAAGDPSVSR
jgi:DNA-3-methyladenine glycosylase